MARNALRLALGTMLAAGAMLAQAETVGRVLLAAGDAVAVRDGKQVRLQFNAPIESKDVLRTGRASSLQVRFIDEGMISLRENSEFVIDEYRFSGKEDGSERGFFSLVKGGFRAVTGAIGKTQNSNYKVRTDTATIGIRGTDYAVRNCQGDCGTGVANGLYGTVLGLSNGTNQVTLTNSTGEHVFGTSQNFHVANNNSAPRQLLAPPTFISLRPQGKAAATQQGGTGSGGERAAGSSGAQGESRPQAVAEANMPEGYGVLRTPTLTLNRDQTPSASSQVIPAADSLNSSGTSAVLPPANGFIAVYPLVTGVGNLVFEDSVTTASFNGQNQLLSYGTLGTFPAGSLGGGTITDTGSVTLSNGQTFVWGRWTGNTQIMINGSLTVIGVPLLFGTATGLQNNNNFVGVVGGSATYNFAGGPSPVDAGGNVGSVTSSSLLINFTQLTASYSLGLHFPSVLVAGVNMGAADFSVSGTATHQQNGAGEFSGSLSGTCAGSGCKAGTASGGYEVGLTGAVGYEFSVVGGAVDGTKAGGAAFLNAYTVNTFTPGAAPTGALAGQVAWSHSAPSLAGTWSLDTSNTAYNSSGQPISFNTALSGVPIGTLGTGSIVESGSASLVDGGTISWGRWSGGKINDPINGLVTVNSGVPFVVGNANTSVPTGGSFVYNLVGGPNVVTNTGTVGGPLTAGALQISFGPTQTISVLTPLQFSVGGLNYSLSSCTSGCSTTGGNVVWGIVNLQGTCTGAGACSTPQVANGNSAAFLLGPQAGGLAVAGNVFAGPAPTVTFAGAFKR